MVSIGVAVSLISALLLWKGAHSRYHGSYKLKSVMDQFTITEPRDFPVVHYEDFVPKKCGDKPTKDGFVKWNVFIQTGRFYRSCVGTLISRSFVLTSGHCVKGIPPDEIKLFLGQVHMRILPFCVDTNRCQQVRAEKVWENKFFNVALIKTQLPVIESEVIQPICLPLNVTVEDIRQENEKVLQTRIPVGRGKTKLACGNWGVPIVAKDRTERYNIVSLASLMCNPMVIEREPEPVSEYVAWIITILPNGEKELPLQSMGQAAQRPVSRSQRYRDRQQRITWSK